MLDTKYEVVSLPKRSVTVYKSTRRNISVNLSLFQIQVHAMRSDYFLPTFRDNPSVPSAEFKNPKGSLDSLPPKMGQIDCPETSVRINHYSLRNTLEERSSQAYAMVQAVKPPSSQSAPAVVRVGFVLDTETWVGFCVRVLRFSSVSVTPSASISLFYSSTTFRPKLCSQQ